MARAIIEEMEGYGHGSLDDPDRSGFNECNVKLLNRIVAAEVCDATGAQ
jgi:hypothetical protein